MPRQSVKKTRRGVSFGPVSTINTAPVAIGNSIRGSKARATNIAGGSRVVGRDFGFQLNATASSIQDWQVIGGMPLTPAVLPSSVLRNYCQMYNKFKINSIACHYITSSPTSQAGDILFYYEKDRKSPSPDFTNSSFLPFVLSDPYTVIGPQWTNHTLAVKPVSDWKTTNFGMNSDLNEDACGTVWLFSKTNATNSPGYVIIDYDISFMELSVNPRAGQLPVARGQANPISFGLSGSAVTAGSTTASALQIRGVGLDGAATAMPNGSVSGDIFKFVASPTASTTLNTWTNVTPSTLLVANTARDVAVPINDGFTCYIVYGDSTAGGGDTPLLTLYPTLESAIVGASTVGTYLFGVTATVTFALIGHIQLVASASSSLTQSSY